MARRFTQVRRRSRRWLSMAGSADEILAAATGLQSIVPFTTPETIVRMMGGGSLGPSETAPVAGDAARITLAIGVVTSDAATLGATAMPDPANEAAFSWLWWKDFSLKFNSTSVDPSNQASSVRFSFDVKSQRILRPNQSLVFISQYTDIAGTPPVQLMLDLTRILVLES